MEEVGAQVAPPLFLHQSIGGRFCEGGLIGEKRSRYSNSINHQQHQHQHQQHLSQIHLPGDGWNPGAWEWDSTRFIARPRPLESDLLRLGTLSVTPPPTSTATATATATPNNKLDAHMVPRPPIASKPTISRTDNADEAATLRLQLGGVGVRGVTDAGTEKFNSANANNSNSADDPLSSSRPNKKARSGSPGSGTAGGSYPICQVDNCREDLSKSKDYHRRHKVCEFHSKATKALVGKQMQRFCQQCSRFHPLSEFDEGKRSCRRRLAGHNRRRRKTQPEDTNSPGVPADSNNVGKGNLDIVNLLTVLARGQGNAEQNSLSCHSLSDKNQLIQILSKINSLPLPADVASPLIPTCSGKTNFEQCSVGPNKLDLNAAAGSTTDFLAALSATLAASAPDAVAFLSQTNNPDVCMDKNKSFSGDKDNASDACKKGALELQSVGGEISSSSYQSPTEDSDCQVQVTQVNRPLQLFGSPLGDSSPPNLTRKYFSSDGSNPTEERSPSSSPPVTRKLFPLETTVENAKPDRTSFSGVANVNIEASRSGTSASRMTLELFSMGNRAVSNSLQSVPYQAGYTSSSSDHSPPSFNSDPQKDRTDRISFKLFDKDPSHFPEALRTQIYNWLSNIPSEMESYIRPGCVVLSVYASMPSSAWEQLEENFLQRVSALVQDSDSEFWKSGRFSVNTGRQLAVHKDGKIHLCKPWSALTSPELFMVSPLAVVSGQDTSLRLRGRNLTSPGTKIHCTFMGGYSSKEVTGSACQGLMYDEITLSGFKVHTTAPSMGRCFLEVENGARCNSFPLIIADASICQELRLLESEFDEEAKARDIQSDDMVQNVATPSSLEEVLHFLNELGWLFQRQMSSDIDVNAYMLHRFQFLLTFSIERDYCALVKRLLDILVERYSGMDGLSTESVEALAKILLLHRAVKRRSRKMVHLLVHYSISFCNGNTKKYIFPPNLRGPGGITPLHLAACTPGLYDIVDALTDDPMQIGLNSWNSLLDDNRQSPYSYAVMRNNHSVNKMVARKLADRRNGQLSLSIDNEILEPQVQTEVRQRASLQSIKGQTSCSKCARMTYSRMSSSPGLLNRPFIHSMLGIAAVCVCVCLFFKSFRVNSFAPFMWENMEFGSM